MNKKIMPLMVTVACIGLVVVAWWYLISLSQADTETLELTVTPKSAVNAKTLRDASDKASSSLNVLKVYGKIPLDSGGLERNPDPLFNQSQ